MYKKNNSEIAIRRFGNAVLIVTSLFLNVNFVMADQCPVDLSDIVKSLKEITYSSNKPTPNNLIIWSAHKKLAWKIWQNFSESKLQSVENLNAHQCLIEPLNEKDLYLALNNIFFNETIKKISVINPELFKKLQKKVDINQIIFQTFFYCETCRKDTQESIGARAGIYDLLTRAIFLNLSLIDLQDWYITFFHEFGHYLDPTQEVKDRYHDKKAFEDIIRISDIFEKDNSITSENLKVVDKWLEDGLKLGLLAEWRVWSLTLSFLDSDPDYQLGKLTKWLQPFRKMSGLQRNIALFEYLDGRFKVPMDKIFSNKLILIRIQFLREKIHQSILEEELSPLEGFDIE